MNGTITPFTAEAPDGTVRGFVHHPVVAPGAGGIVLTHGAGSSCRTALLVGLATALADRGLTVLRCDLPFRQARERGGPGRGDPERDRAGLARAVAALGRLTSGPLFLGGHSYGGRQASMLVAEHPTLVRALLLLAYPLHPPGQPARPRSAHFPSLRAPVLFVHGTRDPFGSIVEVDAARSGIPARSALLVIDGARHDLLPRGEERARETIATIAREFLAFVADRD